MIRTSREEVDRWLAEPEGTNLEFKEAKNRYDFEKLVEYVVGLANEGGGTILLGVSDLRPRRVVGTAAFAEPGRTEAGLHQRLGHRVPVEEFTHPDGRVLLVHVPSRLRGTAWQIDGRYLKRAGDDLTALSADELRAIFAETGPDYSAETCPGASLADLDPTSIATFRARWAKKTADDRKLAWTDEQTLTNAELLVDGVPTYAALILFGTHAALGRRLAQAEVVFEYRSSEAAGPAQDRVDYREGFFAWVDDVWRRINLRNDRQSYQDGMFRFELPTFDEITVREAVLNAVAHRDYRLGGSVWVRQFAKRLEIVSPGGLPSGITTENILDQQNPRNRRLADALVKAGLIERAGQGMNLMFEQAIRQGKVPPSFVGTASHEVRLTLDGVMEPRIVRFLEQLSAETLKTFSTQDFIVLDAVARDRALSDGLKSRLPSLIAAGAIESIGRGRSARYLLARRLQAALGTAGAYTRERGLDRETNKTLLLTHLRRQGEAGAPLPELQQVLPAQSRITVQRLLGELRKEGLVELHGQRRWARWVAAAS